MMTLPAGTHALTLRDRRKWADDLYTLHFDGDVPDFEPGQFVGLSLPVDGRWVERHYSIASAPHEKLEFYVTIVAEGTLTPRLFELPIGGIVACTDRAMGRFGTTELPRAETAWMLATGTGLAPFISMLRDGRLWDRFEHAVVVHGVRYGDDLGYRQELSELARSDPRITWLGAVSREETPGTLRGRITALFDSGALEEAAGRRISASTSHVMMCGNPAMLDEMKDKLGAREMTMHRKRRPGQISFEKYW